MVLTWLAHCPFRESFTPSPVLENKNHLFNPVNMASFYHSTLIESKVCRALYRISELDMDCLASQTLPDFRRKSEACHLTMTCHVLTVGSKMEWSGHITMTYSVARLIWTHQQAEDGGWGLKKSTCWGASCHVTGRCWNQPNFTPEVWDDPSTAWDHLLMVWITHCEKVLSFTSTLKSSDICGFQKKEKLQEKKLWVKVGLTQFMRMYLGSPEFGSLTRQKAYITFPLFSSSTISSNPPSTQNTKENMISFRSDRRHLKARLEIRRLWGWLTLVFLRARPV